MLDVSVFDLATPDFGMGAASNNPYPEHQCTWGVWKYIDEHFKVEMPRLPGNATDWVDDAKGRNWKVTQSPTENTVACWSNVKYPPYGHVAFVTKVSLTLPGVHRISSDQSVFTVDEWNFKPGQHGTRDVRIGTDDTKGLLGFILVPGVSTGASTNPIEQAANAVTDPWREFNAGLQSVEQQMQKQVQDVASKVWAGAQIGAGLTLIAGGGVFAAFALRNPQAAQGAARSAAQVPSQMAGKVRRNAVPVAQDAVLGPVPPDATPAGRVPRARVARTLPR